METTNALSAYEDQKLTIFLAEDDEDDAVFFKETLANFLPQVKITVLEDGDLMMRHLLKRTEKPDIIFLDLNMPKKNGIDCLREIKQNEEFNTTKIVILSTSSDEQQIKKCYRLGADHFITKPSNMRTLQRLITQCLESLNLLP